jgi:hypothetical protein
MANTRTGECSSSSGRHRGSRQPSGHLDMAAQVSAASEHASNPEEATMQQASVPCAAEPQASANNAADAFQLLTCRQVVALQRTTAAAAGTDSVIQLLCVGAVHVSLGTRTATTSTDLTNLASTSKVGSSCCLTWQSGACWVAVRPPACEVGSMPLPSSNRPRARGCSLTAAKVVQMHYCSC